MIKYLIKCNERGIFAGTTNDDNGMVFTSSERYHIYSVPVFETIEMAKSFCVNYFNDNGEYHLIEVEVPDKIERISYQTLHNSGNEALAREYFINMPIESETIH